MGFSSAPGIARRRAQTGRTSVAKACLKDEAVLLRGEQRRQRARVLRSIARHQMAFGALQARGSVMIEFLSDKFDFFFQFQFLALHR
jgi:hypothetical protein